MLGAASHVSAYDWLQFNGNAQHSGNNTAENLVHSGNVNRLTLKFQASLPASSDGAPVFLEAVSTLSGVKDLLFITTTAGHIVALDAQTGGTVWTHQYDAGSCKINNGSSTCYTTSSPAVDPNRLYVYTYGLDGHAHKLQVGDGTEIIIGGWPQLTTFKGYDEKGSSALSTATSAGTTYLYVTHGGYPGDNGDYQGHVTAINLATGTQTVFNTACSDQAAHLRALGGGVAPTCATRQNAIWSRPGVMYDAGTDRIFMGTGNAFNAGQGQFDGVHNWSESVIALHPDATGGTGPSAGKPLDSYTPTNHVSLDAADADVGSTVLAILPVPASSVIQHLGVQSGKDSTLRLLNLQDLNGHGAPGSVGGEIGSIVSVPQGGGVLTQPVVWVNPADHSTWVFVVNNSGANALRLSFDAGGNPSLVAQWHNNQGGFSPLVANNVLYYAASGVLRAVDPGSGTVIWSSSSIGSIHWQSPIVANGVVYVADSVNHLTAFSIPGVVTPPKELGYTPVPACRLVDTRVAVGALGARAGRNYAASDNTRIAQAGGNAAGCGIPAGPEALALTLTAVQPALVGNLIAYPSGSTAPLASSLNFLAGQIVANTTVASIAPGAGDNFSVFNNSDGTTPVVVDVVGYFWEYQSADCSKVTQSQSVAAGGTVDVPATCSTGYVAVGGGCSTNTASASNWLAQSATGAGDGYHCKMLNSSAGSVTVTADTMCCRRAGR